MTSSFIKTKVVGRILSSLLKPYHIFIKHNETLLQV